MYVITSQFIAATQPPEVPHQQVGHFPLTGNTIIKANNHIVIASGLELFPEIRAVVETVLKKTERGEVFEKLTMLTRGIPCTFTVVYQNRVARRTQLTSEIIDKAEDWQWEIDTFYSVYTVKDGKVNEEQSSYHFIGGNDIINKAILELAPGYLDTEKSKHVIDTIAALQGHATEYLTLETCTPYRERTPAGVDHPLKHKRDW